MSKGIAIAARLRPYSHLPGTACLVPETPIVCVIFPTVVQFYDISTGADRGEWRLPIGGPVEGFTVQLDLERKGIHVWGHTPQGYLRYALQVQNRAIALTLYKSPCAFSVCPLPFAMPSRLVNSQHRLSLGNHKAQDWELVNRRGDLREILPRWHRLGQLVPSEEQNAGTDNLLAQLRRFIEQKQSKEIVPMFRQVFRAGFNGILVPQLDDLLHQGFAVPPLQAGSPLALLSEGARLIESLFIDCREAAIHLLPVVPPEFYCGRFTGWQAPWGSLSFEWTKKTLFRVEMRAEKEGTVPLLFPSSLKRMRLRENRSYPGQTVSCRDFSLAVSPQSTYLLDRFEE